MQKTILAQILTALVVFTAAIYFVAAVEESQEEDADTEVNEQEAASSGDSENEAPANSLANQEEEAGGGDALATQVQIAFFTAAGLGYAGVGIWIFKDKGKTNAPYVVTVVASIAMIGIYVASRTIDLPIVGLQEDVGAIDILTKVLQLGIVGLGTYMISAIKVTKSVYSR